MIVLLFSAACVALVAMIVAWRSGRGVPVIFGLGGLAGALAVAAWVLGPAADAATDEAPRSWLVDSAQAFNGGPIASQRQQAGSLPPPADRPTRATSGGTSMLDAVTKGPGAAARFVAEGQQLRIQRRFPEAAEAFRKAVEADPGDADSWADLADSAAVAAGRDLTVSRDAIERALSIDPQHRKALWLRASLELQEGRYAQAARTWRTLSGLVAPGSPDARVIAANISEADALAAGAGREG